jgi:hypothetical protein
MKSLGNESNFLVHEKRLNGIFTFGMGQAINE